MPKTVAIIGSEGFVGSAFRRMVEGFYDVVRYDPVLPDKEHRPYPRFDNATQLWDWTGCEHCASEEEVNACDVAIVCVPTPMSVYDHNGCQRACDTSIVEEVVSWLDTPLIVIKSTVVPGTTARLVEETSKPIIFSPEYTSARKYYVPEGSTTGSDMTTVPMVVAGGHPELCREYFDLLIPILGSEKQYVALSATEAELTKYMSNFYGGLAVTFANEMYEICKVFGCDWYKVWNAWGLDPAMPTFYTAVFPEDRGFGGTCLPKDISALARAAIDAGYDPLLVCEVLRSNKRFRGDKP